MELLLEEIQKLSKNLDINRILAEIFSEPGLQKEILDKIRNDQWFDQGVSESNVIIGVYSPYTQKLNPDKIANTPYTLHDTGQLSDSLKIDVDEFEKCITIDTDGDRNIEIVYKFDTKARDNILGLTESSLSWLQDKLNELIPPKIEAIL